ncbi:MAG: restriction endonuclease subunit S [Pseudomonadota bacterium]
MKWPQGWREVRVADALYRVADKFDPSTATTNHFYVGLEHIESHSGRMLKDETATEVDDLLSTKTRFKAGDVLFGKLRPNLNKVYLAPVDGICSTDIWALRPRDFVLSEYAALYLRSEVFNRAVTRLAVGANLPRVPADAFDRMPFLLPPLPEQQRIVEVLREANEAVSNSRARRAKLAEIVDQQLASTIARCKEMDWIPLGRLVTSKYGTSVRADADESVGVPVLRIPNVIGGEVDVSDLKYVELPKTELDRLRLTEGDVLIVRSNGNPDYVGRCAAVDEATTLLQPVYASYLIRLRPDQERLLGSYLAALLNSSVGRNAMRNAIRTTAGQSNLSADALAGICIPVPSPEDQRTFAQVWEAAQTIRRQFELSERSATTLNTALITEALSGRLTASWREQHVQALAEAARERDARLGAPAPRMTVRFTEHAPTERRTDLARPRRQAVIEQLSSFQHEVWNTLRFEWRGAVLADDPAAFEELCTSPQTAWRLEGFAAGREEVRRALEQLAAMGLVRKMSLPRVNPNTGRTEYLTAFRPLREAEDGSRPEEDTALADAERLARELERRRVPEVR